jgi:hypothetical protein
MRGSRWSLCRAYFSSCSALPMNHRH